MTQTEQVRLDIFQHGIHYLSVGNAELLEKRQTLESLTSEATDSSERIKALETRFEAIMGEVFHGAKVSEFRKRSAQLQRDKNLWLGVLAIVSLLVFIFAADTARIIFEITDPTKEVKQDVWPAVFARSVFLLPALGLQVALFS